MRPALPPLELVIDELVIDAEVLGPSGHVPSLVLALQGELGRLLGAPAELAALRARGGLQLDSLSAGRVAPAAGPGLAAALAQALAGALAGAGRAAPPSPPSPPGAAAQPSSGRKEPT